MNKTKLFVGLIICGLINLLVLLILVLHMETVSMYDCQRGRVMAKEIIRMTEKEEMSPNDFEEFLMNLSDKLKDNKNFEFYGDVVYTDQVFDVDNTTPNKTFLVTVWDETDYGKYNVSRSAKRRHEEIFLTEERVGEYLADNSKFVNYKRNLLYANDYYTYSYASYSYIRWMEPNYFARLTIEYYAYDYYIFYILVLLISIVLECLVMIVILKHKRKGIDRLMSSTLTVGLSHELKTPLAILRLLIENWDYIEAEDRQWYLGQLSTETDHIEELAQKIQRISQLDSKTLKIKKQSVDIYSIIEHVIDQQNQIIRDRNLSLSIQAAEHELCFVQGDPELLRMAISNFISNAVKYSNKLIKVQLISGKRVRFQISNDGKVLSKEEAKKVWDLFYKTDKSRTDRLGSSGVGLNITKRILKAHKARFGYSSAGGENTFWFEMRFMKPRKANIKDEKDHT